MQTLSSPDMQWLSIWKCILNVSTNSVEIRLWLKWLQLSDCGILEKSDALWPINAVSRNAKLSMKWERKGCVRKWPDYTLKCLSSDHDLKVRYLFVKSEIWCCERKWLWEAEEACSPFLMHPVNAVHYEIIWRLCWLSGLSVSFFCSTLETIREEAILYWRLEKHERSMKGRSVYRKRKLRNSI